jgi:methylase of polypeptide subunit release factors
MGMGATPEPRTAVKARGGHYTPPGLATFLAETVIEELGQPSRPVQVLDPACGDGSLLVALANALPPPLRKQLHLVGFDTHEQAIKESRAAFHGLGLGSVDLRVADFLSGLRSGPLNQRRLDLDPAEPSATTPGWFDVVIANPPYVRTQVLGAERARGLAQRYGLSGRVDLYHAFLKAIALALREGGVLGLLTSNRFLVTQAGAAMREVLREDFDLLRLIDLGDTKLFSAAVLPAIAVARRRVSSQAESPTKFTRVYEIRNPNSVDRARARPSILDALKQGEEGLVRVGELCFNIERGALRLSADPSRPWALASRKTDLWSQAVAAHTVCYFGDIGKIRVGIKTTADPVFIRTDWDSLPPEMRPEDELLRPLLTHRRAARWRAKEDTAPMRVLYPHTTVEGKRVAVDLGTYPRARAYLESHRQRLSARKYVIEAGRRWYELWVPQQPADWAHPKIVFPDISETPRFFLEDRGTLVNGDCYWITLPVGGTDAWPLLMLAVANSTFIERHYDIMFNNKLYAGRRRFLTQYVERFPLPSPDSECAKKVMLLAGQRLALDPAMQTAARALELELDRLVWELFGLVEEAGRERDLELPV